ncbi:MAG: hypothetical protein ACFE9D_05780 [Promethearchaeota archaeon]
MYETPSPMPTLTRVLTLAEFLLSRRPGTEAEILCCLAFYQRCNALEEGLTASMVQQQLRLSPYKINNISVVLQEASEKHGYLKRKPGTDQEVFVLTEVGANVVKQLPRAPE